jgi:hypothetical protein
MHLRRVDRRKSSAGERRWVKIPGIERDAVRSVDGDRLEPRQGPVDLPAVITGRIEQRATRRPVRSSRHLRSDLLSHESHHVRVGVVLMLEHDASDPSVGQLSQPVDCLLDRAHDPFVTEGIEPGAGRP